jgi:hypothetical protein
MHEVHITKDVTFEIVTSGYDDRRLKNSVAYRVHVANEFECSFSNVMDLHNFLEVLGYSDDDAWAIIWGAKVHRRIAGWATPHRWLARVITGEERDSIGAYLILNTPARNSYNKEYLTDIEARQVPLDDDLVAIIKWQLSECDRMNVFHWGHPNGQAHRED